MIERPPLWWRCGNGVDDAVYVLDTDTLDYKINVRGSHFFLRRMRSDRRWRGRDSLAGNKNKWLKEVAANRCRTSISAFTMPDDE